MELIDKKQTKTSLGCLSKGWYTERNELFLVKGNSDGSLGSGVGLEPFSEVLAYRLGKLLGLDIVEYTLAKSSDFPEIKVYGCDYVSVCKKSTKIGQRIPFSIWADITNGTAVKDYFSYYWKSCLSNQDLARMLIFDAVTGNSDRHLNNFDIIVQDGKSELGDILDNGASLLSLFADNELELWPSIGPDKSKPFKDTHTKQVDLLKRRLGNVKLFSADKDELFKKWCNDSEDVFVLMNSYRVSCIKNYVKHRLRFIDAFNGGITNALNVF